MGIAHTRWATHGIANETNAHPHTFGEVTIVHNGIIENYVEIAKEYNFNLTSQTDTEVACAYINEVYKSTKDKLQCIKKAISKFRGSFAFGIMFNNDDNIYAVRYNSPLVIGISDNGNYISSDTSAFLKFTKNYIVLNHNEYAVVGKNKVEIYDENLNITENKVEIATWSDEMFEKCGYDHFMLKEIHESPEIIDNIFKRYLTSSTFEINDFEISKYNKIDIVACGSAMHAGYIGKYLFETYGNIEVNIQIASEYRYKKNIINDKTLVIIISQSGETADSLAALRLAKEKGATTLSIVNVVGSSIARESDINIYTYAGPEIAVATTKGYLSQVAVLTLLALTYSKGVNKENVINEFKNLRNILTDILNRKDEFKEIAKDYTCKNNLFFIGRNIDYYTCLEGSLKLKEISYIHSEAYAAGELKHGTISLIEENTPVIAISTLDYLNEKTISNIKETKARGAEILYIATKNLDSLDKFYNKKIIIPTLSDFTSSFAVIIVLQLLSYYIAYARNCDIDKPKNLAKSVTVE